MSVLARPSVRAGLEAVLEKFSSAGRTGRVEIAFHHKEGKANTVVAKTVWKEGRKVTVETVELELTLDSAVT